MIKVQTVITWLGGALIHGTMMTFIIFGSSGAPITATSIAVGWAGVIAIYALIALPVVNALNRKQFRCWRVGLAGALVYVLLVLPVGLAALIGFIEMSDILPIIEWTAVYVVAGTAMILVMSLIT